MINSQDPYFNMSPIIEFVISECNYESVFEYLMVEKDFILNDANKVSRESENKPTLTWNLNNIRKYVMRSTDPFQVENGYWVLSFSYFPNIEDTLNISIKMDKNPEEDKDNKDSKKLSRFSQGVIVSLMTSVRVNDCQEQSKCKIQFLISNAKASIPLEKVSNDILEHGKDLKVDIYLKMKYTHSAILNYINRKFPVF